MKKILSVLIILSIFGLCSSTKAVTYSSYCLIETSTNRVLKSTNKDSRFLTASIAKILTAICAIEYGSLDSEVLITKECTTIDGSKVYIEEGDKIKLIDLIYGLILRSGNDCAHAIALAVGQSYEDFIFLMNNTAKKIKMTNSTFENPTGLNDNSFNYSTSYDMCLLTSYCMKNEIFREIFSTKKYHFTTYNQREYLLINKHRLVQEGSFFTGGKTGYTKMSGRTLVTTAKENDMDLVCVTMNMTDDFNFHRVNLKECFNKYKKYLVLEEQILKQKALEISYYPVIEESIYFPLTKKELNRLRLDVYLKPTYTLECGYISFILSDEEVYRIALKALKKDDLGALKYD